MNIIFDLDGTLIDSSERMYRLFQEMVPESKFSKEDYWNLKRDKVNHKMILERYFPWYDFDIFNEVWLSKIELSEYLEMDCNYPDTISTLHNLSKRHRLVLLTARQKKDELLKELCRLEIQEYFASILITEAKMSKEDLIISSGLFETEDGGTLFVSDMGQDIALGNKFGFRTVAISHGFMSGKRLLEYNPSIMIEELSELLR